MGEKELSEGTIIKPQVADGYAAYEIVEVGDEVSRVEHRPDMVSDAYHWSAVTADGKVLTDTLREQLDRENALDELVGE